MSRPRGRGGRYATRCTDEVTELVARALRAGSTLEAAAAYAGVPRASFYEWLRKGRCDDATPAHRRLVVAIDKALAEFEVSSVAKVGADGDWRAHAWLLERRFPERYGQSARLAVSAEVQHRHTLDTSRLTLDEKRALIELLEKATDAGDVVDGGKVIEMRPDMGGST